MLQQFIEGIEYTEIPVSDLERAIDWYCNKLEAKLGFRNDELAYVDFAMGPSLFLVKTGDETTSTFLVNGEDHYTIGFRVRNIEGFYSYLVQLGTEVGKIIDEGNVGKFFTFYDPFGNMFDVHQPVYIRQDSMDLTDKKITDSKNGLELQDLRNKQIHMVCFKGSNFHGIDMRETNY